MHELRSQLHNSLSEWLKQFSMDFSFISIKSFPVESCSLKLFGSFLQSLKQSWNCMKVILSSVTGLSSVKKSMTVKPMHWTAALLHRAASCIPHWLRSFFLLLTLIRCYHTLWYQLQTITASSNISHMHQSLHAFTNCNCFLLRERQELNVTFY